MSEIMQKKRLSEEEETEYYYADLFIKAAKEAAESRGFKISEKIIDEFYDIVDEHIQNYLKRGDI
jgi:hypothetical protein